MAEEQEKGLVFKFQRGPTDEVHATVTEFKKKWYMSITLYYMDDEGNFKPTKKGVSLSLEYLPELKDAEISRFDNPALAFEALRADQIDLYIHDAPTSWQLANSRENTDLISLYKPLTEEQLAWAVRPGDHDLLVDLNNSLRSMRTTGTLSYILNRWIPVQIEVR